MSGIIGSIYCALLLLQNGQLNVENERAFIVGVSYPNIYKLGVISRDKINRKQVRWLDILNASSSFEKGVLLHALFDDVRRDYLENKLQNALPSIPFYRRELMQFFEDRFLYAKIANWERIISYFDTIISEEKEAHNLSDDALNQWHAIIKSYCKQKPNSFTIYRTMQQLPLVFMGGKNGVSSIISTAYVSLSLRSLNKAKLVMPMEEFYENCASYITKAYRSGNQVYIITKN